MALAPATTERRHLPRIDMHGRVEVDVLASQTRMAADSVNLSEDGMCVRMQEALEISSRVRLRVFAQAAARPVECGGRITWVIQRLDLRNVPPFLYDVGVEFINPPSRLRQFAAELGVLLKTSLRSSNTSLDPLSMQGREYRPRVAHEPSPHGNWHLVVTVDGAPCVSGRYPSERSAIQVWEQLKRRMARKDTSR